MYIERDKHYIQSISSALILCANDILNTKDVAIEFINDNKCDIRLSIQRTRLNVLNGCVIYFNNVFLITEDCTLNPLWIDTEHFGAKCVKDLSQEVTHIISTSKYNTSLYKGLNAFLVTIDWLEMSIWKWSREPEKKYSLI